MQQKRPAFRVRDIVVRFTLIAVLFTAGLGIRMVIESLSPSNVYRKDFISNYLLARAIRADVNPYTPLPELATQLGIPISVPIFLHPTPHPPPLALFSLPLAWLSYERAALVWLILEIGCVLASTALLLHWWGRKPALLPIAGLTVAAFAWPHLSEDLVLGQSGTLLLLFLVLAWKFSRSADSRCQILSGLMVGCAIALKIIAWPIVVFLALRHRWSSVFVAAAVVVGANIASVIVMGWAAVSNYYLHVGPLVMAHHRSFIGNLSVWSIGWRLFEGTGSPVLAGIDAPPLFYAPALAKVVSYVLALVTLGGGLLAARRANPDLGFGIMVCTILLISPLTWTHYLVLAAIPAVIVARYLRQLGFPTAPTLGSLAIGLLLFVSRPTLMRIVMHFADAGGSGNPTVPLAATSISMIPTVALVGCALLCSRLSRSVKLRDDFGCS